VNGLRPMFHPGRLKQFWLLLARSVPWLSAACATMVVAWWVRSHFATDGVGYTHGGAEEYSSYYVTSGRGQVLFAYGRVVQDPSRPVKSHFRRDRGPAQRRLESTTLLRRAGFYYAHVHVRGSHEMVNVVFPHWLVALPFAVIPAWHIPSAARRRRRLTRGLCPQCGYDLRGSPGRCPECGSGSSAPAPANSPASPATAATGRPSRR